jgi:hypothetical protein
MLPIGPADPSRTSSPVCLLTSVRRRGRGPQPRRLPVYGRTSCQLVASPVRYRYILTHFYGFNCSLPQLCFASCSRLRSRLTPRPHGGQPLTDKNWANRTMNLGLSKRRRYA